MDDLITRLASWKIQKLREYDESEAIRSKKNIKYGSRAGFVQFLEKKSEKQLTAAREKLGLQAALKAVRIQPAESHTTLMEPKIRDFMHWLRDNGVQLNPAVGFPMYFDGIRGVGTTRRVNRGEALFKIPLTRAIDIKTAMRSDLGPIFKLSSWTRFFGEDLGLEGWLPLILLLAHEKMKQILDTNDKNITEDDEANRKKSEKNKVRRKRERGLLRKSEKESNVDRSSPSYFSSWFNVMPDQYDMTSHWSNEELSELHSPETASIAKITSSKRRVMWNKLAKYWEMGDEKKITRTDCNNDSTTLSAVEMKELIRQSGCHGCKIGEKLRHSEFTFELFEWAWSTVDSRVGRLGGGVAEDEGEEGIVRLLPFFGMMNHRSSNIGNGSQPHFAFDQCPVPPAPVVEYTAHDPDDSFSWKLPALVIAAEKDYNAGEEIGFLYGSHDDAHLLLTYGFLDLTLPPGGKCTKHYQGNPHNNVQLRVPSTMKHAIKCAIQRVEHFASGGLSNNGNAIIDAEKRTVNWISTQLEQKQHEQHEEHEEQQEQQKDILQGDDGLIRFGVSCYGEEKDENDETIYPNPFSYFRLLVATDDDIKEITDQMILNSGTRGVYNLLMFGPTKAINDRNELAALKAAETVIDSRIRSFSTWNEDEADLQKIQKESKLVTRKILALQFRVRQKKLLHRNLLFIKSGIEKAG